MSRQCRPRRPTTRRWPRRARSFPAFNAPPAFNSSAGGSAGMPSSSGGRCRGCTRRVASGHAMSATSSSGSGTGGVGGSGVKAPVLSGAGTPNQSTGQSGFDPGPTSTLANTTTNPNGPVGRSAPQGGWNPGGPSSGQDPTFSGSLLGELGGPGGGAAGGLGAGAGASALRGCPVAERLVELPAKGAVPGRGVGLARVLPAKRAKGPAACGAVVLPARLVSRG